MAAQRFKIVLEYDAATQQWVACVLGLDLVTTFGRTREEALANTAGLIRSYVESALADGTPLPNEPLEETWIEVHVPRPLASA